MKKQISDFTVIENQILNKKCFLLKLRISGVLPEIVAGQFVQVRVDNSPETFLRRPISICFADYAQNELWLLVQIAGRGTEKLSHLRCGDILNLIFPLGRGFSIPENRNAALLLVGGGVGVAPLLYLGYILKKQGFINISFLLGARSKQDLVLLSEFEKYGKVFTSTEDGSHGEKGFVTNHSIFNSQPTVCVSKFSNLNQIYTCGPTPMMQAVAKVALKHNIPCEVSLENTMACGIGACLCCVTETTTGNRCVCTEGAVFNVKELKAFF